MNSDHSNSEQPKRGDLVHVTWKSGRWHDGMFLFSAPNCYDGDREWLWLDETPEAETIGWVAGPWEDAHAVQIVRSAVEEGSR